MRVRTFAVGGLALMLLSGCVTTNATLLNGSTIPAGVMLQPEQIAIYRTADQVGKSYREVAILTSTGDSNLTDMSAFHKSMQERAAKVGANAVILGPTREPSTGVELASLVLGVPANRKSEAIAILVDGLIPPPPKAKKK